MKGSGIGHLEYKVEKGDSSFEVRALPVLLEREIAQQQEQPVPILASARA